jgi:Predicted membrane protein (DUF2127)
VRIAALFALGYGVLELVEGTGLWLDQLWAEYLTVIATSLLIPLELYELVRNPRVLKAGGLVVNLAIVAYLVHRELLEAENVERHERERRRLVSGSAPVEAVFDVADGGDPPRARPRRGDGVNDAAVVAPLESDPLAVRRPPNVGHRVVPALFSG